MLHNKEETSKSSFFGFGMVIVTLWALLGFVAFLMSIFCFGRSGNTTQHVIGLLVALFLGPFYWIYYAAVKTYCAKM